MSIITCDLFCYAIDNYGDIGVTYRLIESLSPYPILIRLFLNPQAWKKKDLFWSNPLTSVKILPLSEAEYLIPSPIVIDMFAEGLPKSYGQRLNEKHVWISMEYLNCEKWGEELHLSSSLHPQWGVRRHFFIPGFYPKSGKLIGCLPSLSPPNFLDDLPNSHLKVSVFCYPNERNSLHLQALFKEENCIFLVPEILQPLYHSSIDPKHWVSLPFLSPLNYDNLLGYCDFNIVRGEDSFIRAQYIGRPFLWDIYPQKNQSHYVKLDSWGKLIHQISDYDFSYQLSKAFKGSTSEWQLNWRETRKYWQIWKNSLENKWAPYLKIRSDAASELFNVFIKEKCDENRL